MAQSYDLIVRGGTVIDGTGNAPYVADVGVRNGTIVAIGAIDGSGREEIDACGKLVTPGFVDVHTHYDGQITRGVVAEGYKADLNVIDFARLRLHAPRVSYDLPAGGRRLLQQADGYEVTIVSGVVTYRNGAASGALPGRLVRGARSVPGAVRLAT